MTLKELRLQNKKTAAEVAEVLGVTVQALSNYERGIRQINLSQVLILTKYFDESAEEIIKAQLNSCLPDR